jgi:hypothetical protein
MLGERVEYINWPCLAILKSKIVALRMEGFVHGEEFTKRTRFRMANGDSVLREDIIESKKAKEKKEAYLKEERIKINETAIWELLELINSRMNKIQKDRGE